MSAADVQNIANGVHDASLEDEEIDFTDIEQK